MKLFSKTETVTPEKFDVTITYLEQTSRPNLPQPLPPKYKTALLEAMDIPISFYRYMFDQVGAPHKWVSRRYLTEQQLDKFIHRPDTSIFILYKDGWPAGFCELFSREDRAIEIKFFGLVPDAQGLGLGHWFFHEMMSRAWARDPKRVVIETCTLDNPGALRLYQKMGFTVYDQAPGIVEWRG